MKRNIDKSLLSKEQIRKLRKIRNWSQEDLASLLGVSVTTISRWESSNNTAYPTGTAAIVLGTLIAVNNTEDETLTSLMAQDSGLTVVADGYALYKILDAIFGKEKKDEDTEFGRRTTQTRQSVDTKVSAESPQNKKNAETWEQEIPQKGECRELVLEVEETYRLSRPQLARLLGMTRQGIGLWEKGTKPSKLHLTVLRELVIMGSDPITFSAMFKTLGVILKNREEDAPRRLLRALFKGD